MTKRLLPMLVSGLILATLPIQAQTLFHNASNLVAGSDNTGDPMYQPGTEVLLSKPGLGVSLAPGGSYEHVGQFYVAANGIWNRAEVNDQATIGTDYFGYAPLGIGSNTAYVGKGIQGASAHNGGKGTGRPTFGYLQLNSTGNFPLEGGMVITHSLSFNANGPGKPNLITTPNATGLNSPLNTVEFAPTAIIEGADDQNYIDGYASVTGVNRPFTLPLGNPASGYRPLTINTATAGTVTARYQHTLQHPADALGTGIGAVFPVGNWPISAPVGTIITVSLPTLKVGSLDTATLRLVGWNGSQWMDLSGASTPSACASGNCSLTGTINANITHIAIGSTSRSVLSQGEEGAVKLTLWPNPTQGQLNVTVSGGNTIQQLQALDLQGHPVTGPIKEAPNFNTSTLPAGIYILEVRTSQGQTLRKHFVKQP